MGKLVQITVMALVFGLAVLGFMRWNRSQNLALAFPDVAPGLSAAAVAGILGEPDRVVPGGAARSCDDVPAETDSCANQWQYQEWPGKGCFSVCLGPADTVVSTFHVVR